MCTFWKFEQSGNNEEDDFINSLFTKEEYEKTNNLLRSEDEDSKTIDRNYKRF